MQVIAVAHLDTLKYWKCIETNPSHRLGAFTNTTQAKAFAGNRELLIVHFQQAVRDQCLLPTVDLLHNASF